MWKWNAFFLLFVVYCLKPCSWTRLNALCKLGRWKTDRYWTIGCNFVNFSLLSNHDGILESVQKSDETVVICDTPKNTGFPDLKWPICDRFLTYSKPMHLSLPLKTCFACRDPLSRQHIDFFDFFSKNGKWIAKYRAKQYYSVGWLVNAETWYEFF